MDSMDQSVMEGCFTNVRLGSVESFTFKCRQCTDIADYFVETGPKFRFPVWESYLRDHSKGGAAAARWGRCEQAMKEFCRAVKEAEVFLQGHCCTSAGKNDWNLCAKGLAMLDSGEAYDFHLQNLIWSKAGLKVVMTYAVSASALPLSEDVQKLVEECRRELCRYGSSYKEHRIHMDRVDFNDSIQITFINDRTELDAAYYKYLSFLLRKSQAALPDKSSHHAKPDADLSTNTFEVSDHEFEPADSVQALGEGSFGKVHSTVWLGQIKVAVKVISIYYEPDSDTEADMTAADENFKAEVSLLSRLHSPYIVQLIGWAIDRNKKEGKLVTELMATDLAKVLFQDPENRNAGLPLHVAVDIMLQVSKAMEYLHGQNIMHRDMKPSNILLEPSSVKDFWRVKICDFGLAKMKARQDDLYSTFKIGSHWYRSPEVLSEIAKYGNKADVYSFAITCSEMLGGSSATSSLKGDSSHLLNRILNNQRPTLPADCPAQFSDLIRKCWHTEPDKRPPFCDITMTLSYIKFILMRVTGGVNFNTASPVTPFDEDELEACMSGAAQMETVRADGAMWYSGASSTGPLNPRSVQQCRTRRWLKSGDFLNPMESVTWGRYRLTLQQDANLVLLNCDDMTCLWASGSTASRSSISGLPFICTLKSNGSLVVHSGRQELWSSGSAGSKASYKLELDLDGRAFIQGPNANIIWATKREVLNSGDLLIFNQHLTNNGYKFAMQGDGNLVLYNDSHKALWASNTKDRANTKCRCTLQEDGILVILNANKVVWRSNDKPNKSASYKLQLQRDGNVVIVNPSGTRVWETCTDDGDSD